MWWLIMELYDVLFKELKNEVYIFDVNSNIIAHGEAIKLFEMLGYYFLRLEVTRINGHDITVNYSLGGEK